MLQQVSVSLCVLVIVKKISYQMLLGLAILAYPAQPGQVEVLANLFKTRQTENCLSCQTH